MIDIIRKSYDNDVRLESWKTAHSMFARFSILVTLKCQISSLSTLIRITCVLAFVLLKLK